MYELIILSLLMRTPAHGYLIAHIINDIIGPYARMSNGRLYPLLARLEESGMIEIDEEAAREQHGERTSRRYKITEIGRKRFHSLMMDTTSNPGEYQRFFLQKVSMFHTLQIAERLYLIDHYINYCQAHILHLTAEGEDLATGHYHRYEGDEWVLRSTLDVMGHMTDQWRLEVAWAQRLRAREQVHQAESGQPLLHFSRIEPAERNAYNENQNENKNDNQNDNTES